MLWFKKSSAQAAKVSVTDKLDAVQSNGIKLALDELLHYQSKTALIHLGARKNLKSRMSGNYLARSKGRGMEFDEVRHYQVGDDIRAIDWRVTARTGKTHTKLFREEVERPVLIATDLTQTMNFGSQLLFKSVQAGHLAALLAWHAKERGDRVGGIVFNENKHQELKPRSRQAGVLHYLHTLKDTQTVDDKHELMQSAQAFQENCARLRQLAKPGSLVYLITDGYHLNSDIIHHLSQISQHCELVIALISDPLETSLPECSQKVAVCLTNGQHDDVITLGDHQTAQTYAERMQAMHNQHLDLLSKCGARVIDYSAAELLENQLTAGIASWIR